MCFVSTNYGDLDSSLVVPFWKDSCDAVLLLCDIAIAIDGTVFAWKETEMADSRLWKVLAAGPAVGDFLALGTIQLWRLFCLGTLAASCSHLPQTVDSYRSSSSRLETARQHDSDPVIASTDGLVLSSVRCSAPAAHLQRLVPLACLHDGWCLCGGSSSSRLHSVRMLLTTTLLGAVKMSASVVLQQQD